MPHTAPTFFLRGLSAEHQTRLSALAAQAVQPTPLGHVRWRCGEQPLGLLSGVRAAWLARQLPGCRRLPEALVWDAASWSTAQRSQALQAALLEARAQGLLPGWREEPFSFWHADCRTPEPAREALFQAERSGFRFLGLLSHAVHVNGFVPDGRLWCGRRSLHKATDPGLLDNITAGGLPSGETVQGCLQREVAEEAGLFSLQGLQLQAAGCVRTCRLEPEGWHDEYVHVFNLGLPSGFTPHNQDGEVAEFLCLEPADVLRRMESGAFTVDAVQTLIQGLWGVEAWRRA